MTAIPARPKICFRSSMRNSTASPTDTCAASEADHTLQTTALINEAYLRLVGEDIEWTNRAHFIGLAAHVMRRVLVDYARQHNAERRAGGLIRVEMEDNLAISPERLDEVLFLDEAMAKLQANNPRQARVVELRYFGGLSVEQIAEILNVAPRSVKRDWALARIFLSGELNPGAQLPIGAAKRTRPAREK